MNCCSRKELGLPHTSTEHFIFAQGFDGGSRDEGDDNGIADGVEDLDGVPRCAAGRNMVVYQLSHSQSPADCAPDFVVDGCISLKVDIMGIETAHNM